MSARKPARWPGICAAALLALTVVSGASRAERVLYFAEIFYPEFSDGYVHSVRLDGSGLETLLDTGGGLRAIAIDETSSKLYWTDVDGQRIRWADLDGGNAEDLITTGLSFPFGIALNPTADRLYWSDMSLSQIGSAHLDGTGAAPLLPTPSSAGLAIDTVHGKIYWTTAITGEMGEILRANLDGSAVETVLTGHDRPATIALDVSGGKIYWTDYVVDVVRRANLDGSGVEDLYVVGSNLNPDGIAVDPNAGKVYWGQDTSSNRDKIMRMNLDGTSPEDFLTGSFGIVTSITFAETDPASVVHTLPRQAVLLESRPNPFRDRTTVSLYMPESAAGRIAVFSGDGRRVAVLADGTFSAGRHEILWSGRDDLGRGLPAGVYYCRIDAGGFRGTQRLVVVK